MMAVLELTKLKFQARECNFKDGLAVAERDCVESRGESFVQLRPRFRFRL